MQQGHKIAETEQITVANTIFGCSSVFRPFVLLTTFCGRSRMANREVISHHCYSSFDFGCVSNQCVSVVVFSASLRVSSVSVVRSDHSSICVSWRPVSAVDSYRIVIQSVKGN